MNLPFIKKFNKKVLPLYFLVLILRDEKAQAVVFEEIEGRVKIIGQKEEYFSSSIDEVSSEELLEVLDKAISSAESSLPENIQTQKTIFGVKESWTDNDQIKKDHLAKLKKASEELGLVPIGFLVISQAIAHLLQKEEGAPVSAILTEINKKSITVTLLRAGKSIQTKSSEIHESIPFTVDTLLKHFNIPEILPSRIIIFNGKEDLSQEFISHTWSKSLPFLHLPQITNLPHGFDAKAVLFGAATQMGFEVLDKDIPKEPHTIEKLSEEQSVETPTPYKNLGEQDFGFAKDFDVAKMPVENLPAEKEEEQTTIAQFETKETDVPTKSTKKFDNILIIAKNILIAILALVFSIAGKINLRKILFFVPKGRLSVIPPAILILVAVLIAGYFLFIKVIITITIDPKISQQNKSVLFSTTAPTDPSRNIIKGEFVSVSEEGNVSTAATGKKDVGTNAKGTVTIFNLSDQKTTIPSGTKISSANDIEFTLDNSVSLASASSSIDPATLTRTTKPATTNVNVTANQLGKESNLPSGTKFSVSSSDTSDLIAKNDNPFSGGTKKEVTVVAKNDSDKLEAELLKQLEGKAKKELLEQISQDKILLPAFVTKTLSKKSLNVKVGDEANQVTLSGTAQYQGFSYNKSDLIKFSKFLLSKNVPANQEIDYNNIKTDVLDIKNISDEKIEANLNIKTLLLPKFDKDKLIKELRGKSFKATEDTIYKLPQVADLEIRLSPNLPLLPKNLPSREDNIEILIKING